MTEQEEKEKGAEEPKAATEGAGEAEAKATADATTESAAAGAAGEQKAAPAKAAAKEAGERKKAPREIAPAGPSTAVVVPQQVPGTPIVSRRTVIKVGFWTGLGAIAAGVAACGIDMVYPTEVTGFGGTVSVGEELIPKEGEKAEFSEGKFWLVNLTDEQGGPGLLALWWKCPHLGCTVPWVPGFVWPDPQTGADKQGWFRCPCHGSTYTDAGVRVFGPAPRSLDTLALTVDKGRITVDTGAVTPGNEDNYRQDPGRVPARFR